MKSYALSAVIAATLAVGIPTTAAFAQAPTPSSLQETGKKLSETHKNSVVWLTVISKITMSTDGDAPAQVKSALAGQEKEEKSEALGTIIDESGLIVTALGTIDKSSIVNGQTVNTPLGVVKLKASSEIKEVKIITSDGSEVPADLVMKDEELGLAFIKIRKDSDEAKGLTFKAIDLKNSATGALLDQCIGLSRLDESLNREPSVYTAEITGITTRPRSFYRVGSESIGTPVFLSNGKVLGISIIRKPKTGTATDGQLKLSPIVLPAADIAKIADEAKNAKPAEKTAEAAETPKEESK